MSQGEPLSDLLSPAAIIQINYHYWHKSVFHAALACLHSYCHFTVKREETLKKECMIIYARELHSLRDTKRIRKQNFT